MTTIALPHAAEARPLAPPATGAAFLRAAARFWFIVAVLGQWAFLAYITVFYGTSTATGHLQAWSKNKFLLKGYIAGDTMGNAAFAAHALLAAVIAFGGAIQLIPQIRSRAMAVHRWNGRLFLVTAFGVSITGLYMSWIRGATLGLEGSLATTLNAALILVFGAIAWRTALKRDAASHRRWALRTFMVANGQWFVRVGFFAWIMIQQGRYLSTFFRYWNFACYLLPLALLELYLVASRRTLPTGRYVLAGGLIVLTLLMGAGIFGISMFMWKPLMLEALK